MERIDQALTKAGFPASARDRIMGDNWRRVITSVLG